MRGKLSDRTNFKFFGAQSFVLSGSKLIPLLYNGGVLMNYYLRSGLIVAEIVLSEYKMQLVEFGVASRHALGDFFVQFFFVR